MHIAPWLWWRRFRCRYTHYHYWIDTDGDGITDRCMFCPTKVM